MMKTPQHLFALTKAEQRVVVLIIAGLLIGMSFSRWRQSSGVTPQSVLTPSTTHPVGSPDENSNEGD